MTPNLPVGGNDILAADGGSGRLLEDQTLVTFGGSYTYLGSGRTGSGQASAAVPTIHVVQTTLAARHHFGQGWSVRASLPMGWISVQTPGYNTNQGYTSAGRYTELAGFGDMDLSAGYDLAALWGASAYRPRMLLQAGLAFPTGEQNKDSVQLSASPNVLSLGTGSYSPTFAVTLNQRLGRYLSLGMQAGGRVPLHTNNNGIHMGGMMNGSLALRVLPLSALTLEAAATVQRVGLAEEEERGTMVNSGGVWLRAEPRVAFRASERIHLSLGMRIPFFVKVNGTQAVESVAATLGLSFRFGKDDGAEDEPSKDVHDHDKHHDHDNHHQHHKK